MAVAWVEWAVCRRLTAPLRGHIVPIRVVECPRCLKCQVGTKCLVVVKCRGHRRLVEPWAP